MSEILGDQQAALFGQTRFFPFWSNLEELRQNWQLDKTWQPQMEEERRDRLYRGWQKAVIRTFGWID